MSQTTTKIEIKNQRKQLKQKLRELNECLKTIPSNGNHTRNDHLPRNRGKFSNTLGPGKEQRTFHLRVGTIDKIKKFSTEKQISASEFIDSLVDKFMNTAVDEHKNAEEKPLSFKI